MHGKEHSRSLTFRAGSRAAVLGLAIVLALAAVLIPSATAQTFTVLHSFTNGQDGGESATGVTMDKAGNLYGTALYGGYTGGNCDFSSGCGTVFKGTHKGSAWLFNPLYSFQGDNDGASPYAGVTLAPNGILYGTTQDGGGGGCGGRWLRNGFQPETSGKRLQNRTLRLERNCAVPLHGKQ